MIVGVIKQIIRQEKVVPKKGTLYIFDTKDSHSEILFALAKEHLHNPNVHIELSGDKKVLATTKHVLYPYCLEQYSEFLHTAILNNTDIEFTPGCYPLKSITIKELAQLSKAMGIQYTAPTLTIHLLDAVAKDNDAVRFAAQKSAEALLETLYKKND